MKKIILLILLASASLATSAQVTLEPILEKTGPVSDVPIAIQNARWHMNDSDINTLTFRSMDKLYNTRNVSNIAPSVPLPKNEQPLNFTYQFQDKNYQPQEFLDRTYTNAMLIMKNGKIVYENYLNNSRPDTHFMGWSMTKSLVSIMVGIAVDEGLIKSLNDDISLYLPELKNGAYKGVTVRQVLQMRSGVDYEENYDFSQPGLAALNHITALVKNVARFVDVAKDIKRAHTPGEFFAYKTIDTAVLGLLLERVAKRTLASYMTEHLWEPLGAESNGFFIMDGPQGIGREFSGAGYNAILRDYARIGEMMLNKGRLNGTQIVPESWVAESTKPNGDENEPMDYAYQWWTVSKTQAYSAIGLQGQFIYVDPTTNTVVVKLSYFPIERGEGLLEMETFAFFDAVSKWTPVLH